MKTSQSLAALGSFAFAAAVLVTPIAADGGSVDAASCQYVSDSQELHAFGTVMSRHTVTFKFCAGSNPTVEAVEHDADKVGIFSAFSQEVTAEAPQGDPSYRVTAKAVTKMCLTGPLEFLCYDFPHTFTAYATPTFPAYVYNPRWDQDLF